MNEKPNIVCNKCKGAGWVELPDHLWRVMRCLSALDSLEPPYIALCLSSSYNDVVTIQALGNRLRLLEELGLVEHVASNAPTGGIWHKWRLTAKGRK